MKFKKKSENDEKNLKQAQKNNAVSKRVNNKDIDSKTLNSVKQIEKLLTLSDTNDDIDPSSLRKAVKRLERDMKGRYGNAQTFNVTFIINHQNNDSYKADAEKTNVVMPIPEKEVLKPIKKEKPIVKQEEDYNYFQPAMHLKKMLKSEWFELCRSSKSYSSAWVERFVDALMASEWKNQIARDWGYKDKQSQIKGYILGCLKNAGVIKGSYDSIASLAKIVDNTRTFSRYMGDCKKQPYYSWILDYEMNAL